MTVLQKYLSLRVLNSFAVILPPCLEINLVSLLLCEIVFCVFLHKFNARQLQ